MKVKKLFKSLVSLVIIVIVCLSCVFTTSAVSYSSFEKNSSFRYGVDVSLWNDDLDWKILREQGVEFAYIRIGYYNNSGGHLDKRFKQNVKGCVENGIEFGVYVYSYVYSKSDNIACAKWIDKQLSALGNYCKDKDTIQVAYDIEDEVQINALRWGRISKSYLQSSLEAFCTSVKKYGYIPTVYSFASFFKDYLSVERFQNMGVKIWVAKWPNLNYVNIAKKQKIDGYYPDVWQYGCTLKIAGTVFDTNVSYDNLYDYENEDSKLRIEGLKNYYSYTGKAKKPKFNIYSGDILLAENVDYKLVYYNNVNPGVARVKIIRYNSKGKYKETKTISFNIWDDCIENLSKTTTSTKIKLKWNEVEKAKYYQVYFYDDYLNEYSLIEETELNSTSLTSLDMNTKYDIKIRAVTTLDNKTCYGKFVKIQCRTKA